MKYNEKLNKLLLTKSIFKILIIILIIFIILFSIIKIFFIPTITITGPSTISLNSNYIPSYTAHNYFKDYKDKVVIHNSIKTDREGNYEVTYSLKYLFITIQKKQIVNVVYEGSPTLTLLGDNEVSICPNSKYEEQGFNAYDEYYGDITDKVIVTYDENQITYTIKNKNGKQDIKTRIIKHEDIEKPSIILKGSTNMTLIKGTKYIEPGYTVSDNCASNLQEQVKISGTVDTNKIGTYTLTYTVSDEYGNTTSVTRQINIITEISDNSIIYLTFDDGPSSSITPKILDILREEGVPATFFVINKSADLNYLLIRERDEGHTIALHSATHNYAEVYASVDKYFNDLKIIHDKVFSVTGLDSKIIRFPGGSSNTISKKYTPGIMSILTKQVLINGYNYFDWNVDSQDAGEAPNKDAVYQNVTTSLRRGRSNVVLMHDFENNFKTLEALRSIIIYGKNNGYTFKRITPDSTPIRHAVNN